MKKPIRYIFGVRYVMDMGCGGDVWRIFGVVNGESIMIGFPVKIDKENNMIETTRTIYSIESYNCNENDFWNQAQKDMKLGGFEVH